MITPRHLVGSTLILSWALLLAARNLTAAIYATAAGASYELGLHHQGWTLLICAWLALALGLFLIKDTLLPSK
ncbi:MAG: hypothetical protein OJI67_22150 [Prosthecobacter sp.]|nr:hypothetical protein [Prosthecobacter sp.]